MAITKKASSFSLEGTFWKLMRLFGYFFTIWFIFLPVIWLILTAFKLPVDAYTTKIIFQPTLKNFQAIFSPPRSFGPMVWNSVAISGITVLITIPLATLASYAFSRYTFKGKNALLVSVLSTQFIPPVVVVLPFFALFRTLSLLDTKLGLVILNLSFTLPFAVWMIKGFIDSLPAEIEEAAIVDGCNQLQVLIFVTIPLVMPGIITSAVFTFIQSWNEFLFALILTKREATTVTIGLMTLNAERGILWEQMAAAGLIVMIPIFVLSFSIRRYFVEGITMGAVK